MTFIEEFKERKNKVTIILCAINCLVFIGLTCFGMTEDASFMLQHGAMYVPYFIDNQEYYRIFTSMFLHFGIEHLGSNMLLLMIIGSPTEEELGFLKYLSIYLFSGLAGNALSLFGDIISNSYSISAGASGAVYGVLGALLWIVVKNRGRVQTITTGGLLFVIGFSIYNGISSTGVDNLAHIGGLVFGFILSVILYRKANEESSPFVEDRFYG